MKFDLHYFFKHKNCLDTFFCVDVLVQDDNTSAVIYGNWMIQGTEGYWFASDREQLIIKSDQYNNWRPYEPQGKYRP